jgi:hypothetical protein
MILLAFGVKGQAKDGMFKIVIGRTAEAAAAVLWTKLYEVEDATFPDAGKVGL